LASGEEVPSVTTILKRFKESEGLMRWAYSCGKKGEPMKSTAADVGTIAHALMEAKIHGDCVESAFVDATFNLDLMDQDHDQAWKAFASFEKWYADAGADIKETEVALVSEELCFGGTLDAIGLVDGKLTILDWKTSKKFYPDMLAQMAAYIWLWEEVRGEKVDGCCLARFSKNSAYFKAKFFSAEDLQPAWKYFRHLRYAYKFDRQMSQLL